jgi:hypothetical protein
VQHKHGSLHPYKWNAKKLTSLFFADCYLVLEFGEDDVQFNSIVV